MVSTEPSVKYRVTGGGGVLVPKDRPGEGVQALPESRHLRANKWNVKKASRFRLSVYLTAPLGFFGAWISTSIYLCLAFRLQLALVQQLMMTAARPTSFIFCLHGG